FLTSFIQEEPLVASGKFMETDLDSALPTVNQYVYVKINKGVAKVGQKMLIVKDAGQLRKMNDIVEMPDAYLVQIFGELELTEPPHSENEEDYFEVYRALMTKTFSLSTRDLALIPGEMQEIDLSYEGTVGTTTAQLIGNGKHSSSQMYAPGDVVF